MIFSGMTFEGQMKKIKQLISHKKKWEGGILQGGNFFATPSPANRQAELIFNDKKT